MKELSHNWDILLLRPKMKWSDEIFDSWLESYDYPDVYDIVDKENYLDRFSQTQLRKLLEYFVVGADEWFAAGMMSGLLLGGRVELFDFMKDEFGVAMYELTGKEDYLPTSAKDIFLF